MSMAKRVFVSGCFDVLHAGHVAFLEAAARYGSLTVCVGSDETIKSLKGRPTICSVQERVKLVSALRVVDRVLVGSGRGYLDFEPEIREEPPHYFVVNSDGDRPEKRRLCSEIGATYLVLDRLPPEGCRPLSSTLLREHFAMPYRIDLAGGWLDQPFVSKHAQGAVIVASIEPADLPLASQSGLASSTRDVAMRLWKTAVRDGIPSDWAARILFACENPPGKWPISGSQDAIGIVFPGVNRLTYVGQYWPETIDSIQSGAVLNWLESHLQLVPIGPRHDNFDVLTETRITPEGARALAAASCDCWEAISARDLSALASSVTNSFQRQVDMFPRMITPDVQRKIDKLAKKALGYKVTGAGGGGYLLCVVGEPLADGIPIRIRQAGRSL